MADHDDTLARLRDAYRTLLISMRLVAQLCALAALNDQTPEEIEAAMREAENELAAEG